MCLPALLYVLSIYIVVNYIFDNYEMTDKTRMLCHVLDTFVIEEILFSFIVSAKPEFTGSLSGISNTQMWV